MLNKNLILFYRIIVGMVLLLPNTNIYAQKDRKWEIGILGTSVYNLKAEGLVLNPERGTVYGQFDLRMAYYTKPLILFGFYSSVNLGFGSVDREGFAQDLSTHQDIFVGTTFNPTHSSRFWFRFAAGISRLAIVGQADYEPGGSGGITFVGINLGPGTRAINNLVYQGGYVVKGYPKFTRIAPACIIGIHLKLAGKLFMHFDYKPIVSTPKRNDFNCGLSLVF
jgi:hypothetical protein